MRQRVALTQGEIDLGLVFGSYIVQVSRTHSGGSFHTPRSQSGPAVALNPAIGDKNKGDLATMWVYAFRSQGQLHLECTAGCEKALVRHASPSSGLIYILQEWVIYRKIFFV
jgi:hypothetical protein